MIEPSPPQPPDPSGAAYERPAYLFLLAILSLHFTVGSALQAASLPFGLAFSEVFLFAAPVLLLVRALNHRPIPFLALRVPAPSTLVLSLALAASSFFLAGAVNGVNRVIVGEELASKFDPAQLFEGTSPLHGALLGFSVAILAPLGEELLFRGYLMRVLEARSGKVAALITTAALFAVIHLNPASVLALFVLGLVFGALRLLTGSIWPAVIAHAVQNGVSVALVLSGLAKDAPDELPIEGALLLLAFSAPVVFGLLRVLARSPKVREDDALDAAVPGEDHAPRLHRVARPLGLTAAAALLCLLGFALASALAA